MALLRRRNLFMRHLLFGLNHRIEEIHFSCLKRACLGQTKAPFDLKRDRRPPFDSVSVPRRIHGGKEREDSKSIFERYSIAVGSAALLVGLILCFRRWKTPPTVIETTNSTGHSGNQLNSSTNGTKGITGIDSTSSQINTSGKPPSRRFNFIADVVEIAAPAVVYIELKERSQFGSKMVTTSNGSGFIVRSEGLIITNAHVVANKAVVSIRLHDGRQVEGQVVAVDPVSDLAAVKVPLTNLPVLRMGPSSALRAGEWVVAMGSPLALSNTVTCGIVSSTHRRSKDLGIKNKDMDYIQTDALINFGNSGGPLVDLNGEVIGINTMKVTPGISFAIPSDYASNFLSKVDELLKRGDPKQRQWFGMGSDGSRKRFIGITMLSLTPELIMDLRTRVPDFPDIPGGVLIHKLIVGSPAYHGGLRAGDIIVDINGQPIRSASDVYKQVEASHTLQVSAFRGQHKMMFTINSEEIK